MLQITVIPGPRHYPVRALDEAAKAWGDAGVYVTPPKPNRRPPREAPQLGGGAPGAAIPQPMRAAA